ncbi:MULTISPECIES: hypothetical protein [Acidobacteriaceae]|uniref:hypothetical protein n=1 Tax=Acidobacteriaceae TaxID=204434 RepID=UPI001C2042FF|nr:MULTISPECIES: hypothetical protein [Acidobacteriaceae]MDW5264112.1 hypothetical protein [Edaphobacter sp.]
MARRRNDGSVLTGLSIVANGTFALTKMIFNKIDLFGTKKKQKDIRLAYLNEKYCDETLQRVLQGQLWQGQTAVQVIDSLGEPVAIDRNLLKTRKKEIWKYSPSGVNRYRLRVTLEEDRVVGWDQKE